MKYIISFVIFFFICIANTSSADNDSPEILPAAKADNLVEKHLRTTCKDPYRWMENPDDPALYEWLTAEKSYTDAQTAGTLRDQLVKEFTEIYSGKSDEHISDSSLFQNNIDERLIYRHRFNPDENFGINNKKLSSPSNRYEIVIEPKNTDIRTLQIRDTSIDTYLKDVLTVKFES